MGAPNLQDWCALAAFYECIALTCFGHADDL